MSTLEGTDSGKVSVPVFVLALMTAIASTVAITTQVGNYRLVNITARMKSHEDAITAGKDRDSAQDMLMTAMNKDIDYIKNRVDDILEELKNGAGPRK